MDDQQLQQLVGAGLALSERLALEARYVDGGLVAGLVQGVRALHTRLTRPEPAPPPAEPESEERPAGELAPAEPAPAEKGADA